MDFSRLRRNKKPRERVVVDSSVISSSLKNEKRSGSAKKVLQRVENREQYIYTKVVDDELKAVKAEKDPAFKNRVEKYRAAHRHMIRRTPRPSAEDLRKSPAIRKDKYILHAAIKTKADTLITLDNKFAKRCDGYESVHVVMPEDYLREHGRKGGKRK